MGLYASLTNTRAKNEPPETNGPPILGDTIPFVRDQLAFQDKVANKYGGVVKVKVLGVGEYCLVSHPDLASEILVDNRSGFGKTSDFHLTFGDSILTNEGKRWKRQRSELDEFFFPERIRTYTDEMAKLTNERTNQWKDGEEIALKSEMKKLTQDIIFSTLFAYDLDANGGDEIRQAAEDLNLWFKSTTYALPRWLPSPNRKRFHQAHSTLKSTAKSMLESRAENSNGGDDLLSTLVASRSSSDGGLTDEEIIDQIITLTFAGHDTTSFTIAAALHQLGYRSNVQKKLHQELDEVLGNQLPSLTDIRNLEYTECVLNETLRRFPSVYTLPRVTTEDVQLGGFDLPKGTRIHLSVWRVHRDERFWDQPNDWWPERWEEISPQEKQSAFIPFGAGPRVCIGQRFARLEATLALATICQEYRLETDEELQYTPDMTMQAADSATITVHKRH